MRRRGRNANGGGGKSATIAAASDQGVRRRTAAGNSAVATASTVNTSQNDALPAGPWSHGTGLSIKKQQQEEQQSHHQYYPSGQFHIMGSSPLALTPSLSPLYKVPAPNYYASVTTSSVANAAATTAAAFSLQSMDETIGRIFTTYLPNFFDALAKFQYQQVRPIHPCIRAYCC